MVSPTIIPLVASGHVHSNREMKRNVGRHDQKGYCHIQDVQMVPSWARLPARWLSFLQAHYAEKFRKKYQSVRVTELPIEEKQELMTMFSQLFSFRMKYPVTEDVENANRIMQALRGLLQISNDLDLLRRFEKVDLVMGQYLLDASFDVHLLDGSEEVIRRNIQLCQIMRCIYDEVLPFLGRMADVFPVDWCERYKAAWLGERLHLNELRKLEELLRYREPSNRLARKIQAKRLPFRQNLLSIIRVFCHVYAAKGWADDRLKELVEYKVVIEAQYFVLMFVSEREIEYCKKRLSPACIRLRYDQALYVRTIIFGCSRTAVQYRKAERVPSLGEYCGDDLLRRARLEGLIQYYTGILGEKALRPEVAIVITGIDGEVTHWT